MKSSADIVERWLARTMESYPAEAQPFLSGERDSFRNPVGHVFRENLAILVRELFGAMDETAIAPAVDAMVRVRAVQNFSPADAVRFIFEVRGAAREVSSELPESLHQRVDTLALMAFDRYMSCREQMFNLRVKELKFRMQCAAPESVTP